MKEYDFSTAESLIGFIQKNREKIVGHTLKHLYSDCWFYKGVVHIMTDLPVVIELDDRWINLYYMLLSHVIITCGKKDEILRKDEAAHVVKIRDEAHDFFGREFGDGIDRKYIEDRKIVDVIVERFSHSFELDVQGNERPDGGDYFSNIRVLLDSGLTICFCGGDGIVDGYLFIRCEGTPYEQDRSN